VIWRVMSVAPSAPPGSSPAAAGSSSPAPAATQGGSPPKGNAGVLAVANRVDPVARRFYLGIVDLDGYLQPVTDANPWADIFGKARPTTTYKLAENSQFEVCFLRHPSPALARALRDHLNEQYAPAPERAPPNAFAVDHGFEKWADAKKGQKLLVKQSLSTAPPLQPKGAKGTQYGFVIAESETPDVFWPKGHELYKGWTLYADMPHDACAPVRTMVERLQWHMAALRYPVGDQEAPYRPQKTSSQKGPVDVYRTAESRNPMRSLGLFEDRLAAAVMRFQEHATEGHWFQVAKEVRAFTRDALLKADLTPVRGAVPQFHKEEDETWVYLLGQEHAPQHFSKDKVDPFRLGTHHPGLVDSATGAAIKHWLERYYRKPGKLLVRVVGTTRSPYVLADGTSKTKPLELIALREEAAVQLEAWRVLTEIFGCRYGMQTSVSFRDIANVGPTGDGWQNNSIHKTGLAIDFSVDVPENAPVEHQYTHPRPWWPIRLEQRYELLGPLADKTTRLHKARVELQSAEEKLAKRRAKIDESLAAASPAPAAPGTATGKVSPDESQIAQLEQATPSSSKEAGTMATKAAKIAERKFTAWNPKKPNPAVGELCLRAQEQQLRMQREEIRLLEKEISELENAVSDTKKTYYKLRWCIYGHSDKAIDAATGEAIYREFLSPAQGDRHAVLDTPFIQRVIQRLREHFPSRPPPAPSTPVDMSAVNALRDAWILGTFGGSAMGRRCGLDYLDPGRALDEVRRRFPKGADGAPDYVAGMEAFFRDKLRPFVADPRTPAGGRSLETDYTIELDTSGAGIIQPRAPPDWPRSFLNLTLLGFICSMGGIGTAGEGYKKAREKINITASTFSEGKKQFKPATLATLAQAIRYASNQEDLQNDEVVVFRRVRNAANPAFETTVTALDVQFMEDWANQLAELTKAPSSAQKRKPSAHLSASAARILVKLPGNDAGREDAHRVVDVLNGSFAEKRFLVAEAGERTRPVEAGRNYSGQEFASALEEAFTEFAMLVAEGNKKAPNRTDADRTISIQPVFDTDAPEAVVLEEAIGGPDQIVETPGAGVPRTLEWWHHQSWATEALSWGKLVAEIGYSTRLLEAPREPATTLTGTFDGRGLGYTEKELSGDAGGAPNRRIPSNIWTPGW